MLKKKIALKEKSQFGGEGQRAGYLVSKRILIRIPKILGMTNETESRK